MPVLRFSIPSMTPSTPPTLPTNIPPLTEFLGSGSRKSVHRAAWKGADVAVMTPKSPFTLKRDMTAMMRATGSRRLLQWIGGDEKALICEFAELGSVLDLEDTLDFDGGNLSQGDVPTIMKQVLEGVRELSKLGLQHGDLHARNVLVFSYPNIEIKLGDLGECHEGRTRSYELQQLQSELYALV